MRIERLATLALWVFILLPTVGGHIATPPQMVGSVWPLATCPVCQTRLGPTPVVQILDDPKDPGLNGREIRFDKQECADAFRVDRSKFLKPINDQLVLEQLPLYPAINCVVMPDESLTDPNSKNAGKSENIVVGNRLVRVCCGQCARRVRRDPVRWLAQVDKAIVADQGAKYPLKVCLVSGSPLPTEPVIVCIGSRLLKVATAADAVKAQENPVDTLAQFDAAMSALNKGAPSAIDTTATPPAK